MRVASAVTIACTVFAALAVSCAQTAPRRVCAAPSSRPVTSSREPQPVALPPAQQHVVVPAAPPMPPVGRDVFVPVSVTPALGPPVPSPAVAAEIGSYLRKVKRQVLRNWRAPFEGRQTATLEFQIAADGCVTYATLAMGTDPAVGAGALEALVRAAPFDPPPRGVVSEILLASFAAWTD